MTTRSGFVFYDDLLSPKLREPVGNDARADIGSAARRESDDQPHRTRRIDLRVRGARQRRKQGSPCCNVQKVSSGQLHDGTPGALVIRGPSRSLAQRPQKRSTTITTNPVASGTVNQSANTRC